MINPPGMVTSLLTDTPAMMSHFNLQDEVQALSDGAVIIENEVPARSIDGALDCRFPGKQASREPR